MHVVERSNVLPEKMILQLKYSKEARDLRIMSCYV